MSGGFKERDVCIDVKHELCQEGSKLNIRRQSVPVRITKVWNELSDSVANAPNVNTFKNRLDRHGREEDFLYNYEEPVPGHSLAEDRAKQLEHIDLTIEANACGHEGS